MSSSPYQPLAGMADIGMPDSAHWQRLEACARRVFALYACEEVRTPILEKEELFLRSLGEGTDIVRKEMYALTDRGGRRLALRPEGTAGVLRHAAALGPAAAGKRFYYMGPMFRAERPQAGRRRQFHQIGAEMIELPRPAADAECMLLQAHILEAWGLRRCRFLVNTRGAPEEAAAVNGGLRTALSERSGALCEECRRRLDSNVWRVLDCKQACCREAAAAVPPVTDFMSEDSRAYLREVLRLLEQAGVAATWEPRLVRGLDYYAHTVWEITHEGLGAQDALSGGGRYRVALERDVLEGVGFALGVERVLAALASERNDAGAGVPGASAPVWLAAQGRMAYEENLRLLQDLRRQGLACRMDLGERSLKAQLRAAGRDGARWVVIRGERECRAGSFMLRDMRSGGQVEHALPRLAECLRADPADKEQEPNE